MNTVGICKGKYVKRKMELEPTKDPWIYRLKGMARPGYVFVLDELPVEGGYQFFLPFPPLATIQKHKDFFVEIAQKGSENTECAAYAGVGSKSSRPTFTTRLF